MASLSSVLATNQNFNFSMYIFDNMVSGVKFLMYPRFVQVFLDKQVEGMSKHKGIYVTPSHTKKVFANMKRPRKDFSGKVTPLFQTMMVQALEDMGEDSAAPIDSYSTPIITQPSSSKPKKKSRRKQSLKKRVKQLEKRKKSRTSGLKRLKKVGSLAGYKSSNESVLEPIVNAAKTTSSISVSAADPITTAGEVVTTASATTIHHNFYKLKTKGKEKMAEPEKPLKKKYQIALDEELALRMHAEEQAELERMQKERVAQKEASIASIIE
ncbi:hypothetical protein Tco_1467867 [Tanacetum coccineum]